MNKNDLITLRITDLNPDGNGVGRLDSGEVVFVPLTAPGDLCTVKIIKCAKNYFVGRLEELLEPSACRVESDCAVYHRCGGCVYRHISLRKENELKQSMVQNALKRIGHIDVPVEETVCFAENAYRNKVVYPLGRNKDGEVTYGYYARHTHAIVEHDACRLQADLFPGPHPRRALQFLEQLLQRMAHQMVAFADLVGDFKEKQTVFLAGQGAIIGIGHGIVVGNNVNSSCSRNGQPLRRVKKQCSVSGRKGVAEPDIPG